MELFTESCPYSVYRKDRNLHGGGVMLLINKEIPHMPLKELENNSVSVWVKVFASRTSYYIHVVSWYREPSGWCEDFQLFENQLKCIKSQTRASKLPSIHLLSDFNIRDIVWPHGLNKKQNNDESVRGTSIDWHYKMIMVCDSWIIFLIRKRLHLIWSLCITSLLG